MWDAARPLYRKIGDNSVPVRMGAVAATAVVEIGAITYAVWRFPFVVIPTLACFAWDLIYQGLYNSNRIFGDVVHRYLDEVPAMETIPRELVPGRPPASHSKSTE